MFKKILFKILWALGFINASVTSLLVFLFFLLPHLIRGTFEKVTMLPNFAIVWDVDNKSDFFRESMPGWYGFVAGCHIIVVDYDRDDPKYKEYMDHENWGHVIQNYILGILFYPLYGLFTGFILVFLKNRHSYLDNPFERWARRVAGQKVEIPREEWTDGPNDRFPWN